MEGPTRPRRADRRVLGAAGGRCTVETSQGTLSLSAGPGVDTGIFVAGTGTEMAFAGARTLAATGRITGAGTTRMTAAVTMPQGATLDPSGPLALDSGANLQLNGAAPATTIPTLSLSGGVFGGARNRTIGALTVGTGTLIGGHIATVTGSFAKNAAGQLRIEDNTVLAPQVDATFSAGSFCLLSGAVLRLDHTLTIAPGAANFDCNSGGSQIQILTGGSLQRSSAGTTTISTSTVNAGTVAPGTGQTLDFGGGLTLQPGGTLGGTGTAGGAISNEGGAVSPTTGTLTLSGTLTQSSGQTAVQPGETLAIGGAHSQSGGTTTIDGALTATSHAISGGTLTANGTVGGPVTLTAAGVLDGNGQVNGNVANQSGTVRPGNSPGRLTVNGTYAQHANGTLQVDVAGLTAATEFDQLVVTGAATLGGTLAIVSANGFDPAVTDTFPIVTSAARTGTFATLTGADISQVKHYVAQYPTATPFGVRLAVIGPDAPVPGTPQVVGTVQVGQTVTCNPGSWDNNPTFAFEWLRDGTAIGGATGQTYVLAAADATHQIACRVTGTNAGGSATATSAPRNVPAVAPQNTARPAISGTPATGQTLTCDPGTWTGAPAPTVTFEWLRDGVPIPGATGRTYDLTAADAGHQITCRVTGSNQGGAATATSAAVTPPPPPLPASPTPTPTPTPKPTPPLQNATPQQVATAFGLPPARQCISRRNFQIRLKEPKGIKIKKAKVKVNGRSVAVSKIHARWRSQVDLRGLPTGRFVVAIEIQTMDGRTLKGRRAYLTCTPKRRGSNRGGV